MHDVLRNRLLRKIESLPDRQIYQVLDYIEFLEEKYGEREGEQEPTGFQRFAERLEDSLRKRTVRPAVIREAFQLLAAADRGLSNVSAAGQKFLRDLNGPGERAGSSREREEGGGEARAEEDDSSGTSARTDGAPSE
ncbi:MAG: DUF2281 domain-containing protein [Gammaproteobacteria bacterium]|nr:DUF2281 domain-containing protein [Gammaproteobacteria bacterium]MDE0259289.1 DUF2281 domain-containing protein [Gammaproteobacteria bacterium]